jgi:peptidyl-tRNA hydrolase, PTH1 family
VIVIAGLGNPGKEYERTRHNVGFCVVNKLAIKHNISLSYSSKDNAVIGKGTICNTDTILVKPLTFMNLSGEAILKILNWYKIEISDLIVVHDDIDLNLGRIRFKPDGNDGGHNGIRSIISCLGNKNDFNRLKIGIGPGPNSYERKNFVLEPFLPDQEQLVFDTIELAVKGLEEYLKNGLESSMNRYNGINLNAPSHKSRKKGRILIDNPFAHTEKNGFTVNISRNDDTNNLIFPVDLKRLKF